MAQYGFAPLGYGLTGGGSMWGMLGPALVGGLNAGFQLENQYRNLANRNITDQFTVPAAAAGADAARLGYANQAMLEAAAASELTSLQGLSGDPQVRGLQESMRQSLGYYPTPRQLAYALNPVEPGAMSPAVAPYRDPSNPLPEQRQQPLGPLFAPQ